MLLLLLAHYDRIGCTHLYMKAGTSNAPKYFPVHEIRMLLSNDLVDTLLAFHAITRCDSVSQFTGHGKKTAWAVFKQHHTDLVGLGKGSLTEDIATSTEKFICKIYGVPEVDTCNKARVKLFCIGRTQETLPTTSDAAKFHIMHSYYQASVWNQSTLAVSSSSSSDRNEMDASGRAASATVAFSATYPESLQGDHLMWLYKGVPQPTLQLQENSYGMHRVVQLQETWRQLS